MTFDPTVSLGAVLQALATIAAVLGAYVSLRERLARVETKMDVLWERRHAERG